MTENNRVSFSQKGCQENDFCQKMKIFVNKIICSGQDDVEYQRNGFLTNRIFLTLYFYNIDLMTNVSSILISISYQICYHFNKLS